MPSLNATVTHRGIEGQRNRRCRRIGMIVHRNHDVFHWQIQLRCCGLDDAEIRLVRHQPVDILVAVTMAIESFSSNRSEGGNGAFENGVAIHADERGFGSHGAVAGGDAGRHVEKLFVFPVSMDMGNDDPRFLGPTEYDRARAISE